MKKERRKEGWKVKKGEDLNCQHIWKKSKAKLCLAQDQIFGTNNEKTQDYYKAMFYPFWGGLEIVFKFSCRHGVVRAILPTFSISPEISKYFISVSVFF